MLDNDFPKIFKEKHGQKTPSEPVDLPFVALGHVLHKFAAHDDTFVPIFFFNKFKY